MSVIFTNCALLSIQPCNADWEYKKRRNQLWRIALSLHSPTAEVRLPSCVLLTSTFPVHSTSLLLGGGGGGGGEGGKIISAAFGAVII